MKRLLVIQNSSFPAQNSEKFFNNYSQFIMEDKIHFDGIFINGDFSQQELTEINDFITGFRTNDCPIILNAKSNSFLFSQLCKNSNILIIKEKDYSKEAENIPWCSTIITDCFVSEKRRAITLKKRNSSCEKKFFYNIDDNDFINSDDFFVSALAEGATLRCDLEDLIKNILSKPAHNLYGADFESVILQPSDNFL